jgi:hypothetical protein
VRDDVAACVARWDSKTQRVARKRETLYAIDGMAKFLGDETVVVVEPAAVCDEERVARVWGAFALTDREVLFNAASGHLRVLLAEVEDARILPPRRRLVAPGGGGCTLAIGSAGGVEYFEIRSSGAVERLWPALDEKVRSARAATA